ncbi:MAG: cohesin domain-containing protein [Bacteroidia bacterium]
MMLLSLKGLGALGGGFLFHADSVSADPGTVVVVPIRASGFDSIISIQGTIGWDSSKLDFQAVTIMGLPSMSNANFGMSYINQGRLTFSWNEQNLTPITVADSTVIFAVSFMVTGPQGADVPVNIIGSPTLLEVVDWSYTPIGFSVRSGNVHVNVLPVCEFPDSLGARQVGTSQADLVWYSQNAGADYTVEWGTWGFVQGNGLGTVTGTSSAGLNTVQVTGLTPGSAYEYYVHEQCDSSNATEAGPSGFMTDTLRVMIPDTVFLFADSVADYQGSTVHVALRVGSFANIVSAQGTLYWDPSISSYQSVSMYGLPSMSASNFGTSQTALGKLTFSWNDPSLIGVALADSSAIFEVEFQLVGAPGTHTDLDSTDVPVIWEFVNTDFTVIYDSLIPGYMLVLDTSTQGIDGAVASQLMAYPNPVSLAEGNLRLRLPEGSEVEKMEWINALGQTTTGAHNWQQSGGEVACRLPSGLVPGVWTLRVETAAGPLDYRIVVDRH